MPFRAACQIVTHSDSRRRHNPQLAEILSNCAGTTAASPRDVRCPLVLALVLATLFASSAFAQSSLRSYLPESTRVALGREALAALDQLDRSVLPRPALRAVLGSKSATPYLGCTLPRIAELAEVPGMGDLLDRFASNGQGVAYEIAVAHAYRSNLSSVSAFLRGNELDGTLRSGTVIESKSAEPHRPEHLLLQLRRRAEGGQKVILALGYRPGADFLQKLRALSTELGGRLEVHHIPLTTSTYEVLVEGRGIENPCSRTRITRPAAIRATASSLAIAGATATEPLLPELPSIAPRLASGRWAPPPERSWLRRALDPRRLSTRSPRSLPRSNLRASTGYR